MKKIPTLIGLLLIIVIIVGLAITTATVKQNINLFSRADTAGALIVPLSATNITDKGFTLYWISATAKPGIVFYGQSLEALDKTLTDNTNSQIHFLSVTGLKAGIKYYYRLEGDKNTLAGEVTTLSAPLTAVADPIFGKSVPEAVAVWEKEGVKEDKVAALTKADGSYVLPVSGMTLGQKETITIYTISGNATITCISGKDKPLPTVGVGDNVDCNDQESNTPSVNSSVGFTVPQSQKNAVGGDLTVNFDDKETVSTPLPTFSGKAGPNQVVKIEIRSPQVYSGTVAADSAGNWSWTPPANLTPGKHTATITVANPDGTTQIITRTFTVPAGATILPITSGTPSATPTHQSCVNQA